MPRVQEDAIPFPDWRDSLAPHHFLHVLSG